MEGGWISVTGLPPTPPKTFNLNPNANVFVPKNVKDNGSSAKTSQPPAPFHPEIQQSMPNSSEITNVIPHGYFPPQMADSHPHYVPVPMYGQALLPNYVVTQQLGLNNYVQFPQNQIIQIEKSDLLDTQSIDNDQRSSGTLNAQFSDPIQTSYETCSGDLRKGRGEEGNKRLVSDRDSRNSEESDQEKSVSADNVPRRSRESSRDNNRPSWNEERTDNRSVGNVDFRQSYQRTNRGFNEGSHRGGRGKRFFRGNDYFPHRGHKHSGYQDQDPTNEECFNKRFDRSIEKTQYHETHKGRSEGGYPRGRGSRSFRGYHNFSHRGHKHSGYQEQSADLSNEEYFDENFDRKIQYREKGYNEDDYRRGRENRSFRGNDNFSSRDRRKDFNKNHDSHVSKMNKQSFKPNDTSDRDSKNWEESKVTQENSVSPLIEKPFHQGHDKNDQRLPNEYDQRRGRPNNRDKETLHHHNKKRDFKQPSDTNIEHGNSIDENTKYEHSSERGSKNLEESNFTREKSVGPSNRVPFGQTRDQNDQMGPNLHNHKKGRETGNGNRHFGLNKTNPEHRDSRGKYRSSNNRGENEKHDHLSKQHYERNYDKSTKSLHETNAFLENKPGPKTENKEESIESKKENTYSEKAQNQNVKKKYENPKKNDWTDRNRVTNFDNESRDNQEFSEDSKEKRKRNENPEEENPENKLNNLNSQPIKLDSGRENKHWNINSNTSKKDSDFKGGDGKNLENDIKKPVEDTETYQSSYEHDVGDVAQKESNTDSLVDLDSEAIAKKERLSKEKDRRNAHKSVSKSYSDTSNGDKQDFGDNVSLMESLMAKENEMRMQNRVNQENFPTVKDDDKRNKKDTRRKPDDIETKKLLDPRMERKKENAVDGSKGMRVTVPRESSTPVVTSYLDDSLEKEKRDKEYDEWDNHWEEIDDFKIVCEIQGNLFEQPKDFSLAHCVAEDLRMGSGIAVDFKREFKNLPNLLDQRAKQGGLATLHDQENGRFVYYLVTKKDSSGKPTYYTMWKSLFKMRDHIKENKVTKLAIPRLGCGLDRLEWDKVKAMLECLFKKMKIEIRVCNFQQPEQADYKSKCKLVIEEVPVTKIDPGTLILYLATAKGEEDDVIKHMSKKFNFWPSFKKQEKNLGDIVYFDDKVQNYGICACIVRKTRREPISFLTLHSCLQKINKKNKEFGKDCFEYVALQWVNPNDYFDDSINQKLITMLINFLRNVDVYVCNGDFEERKP